MKHQQLAALLLALTRSRKGVDMFVLITAICIAFAFSYRDERPAPRIIGLVSLADGATPPLGIGGKDWRIEVKDADGKSDAFAVSYNGASYAVKIDTAKLPASKAISLTLWDGDTADRIIEGINPSRSMVLDLCFSK